MANKRADHTGKDRTIFEKNRKRILMANDYCGICGGLVDKSIKFPDPLSPVVDHIIPLSAGGDPSAIDNLQLAHKRCNEIKYNRISITPVMSLEDKARQEIARITGRSGNPLEWSTNWKEYRFDNGSNNLESIGWRDK